MSRMVFDGTAYAIDHADIVAALPDPYWCDTYNKGKGKALSWSIRFEAKEKVLDDEPRSPNVEFNGLDFLKIKDWHDLVGTSVTWSKPVNETTGERYGTTYVFDHQLIMTGKLEITRRKGTVFSVVASGVNEESQKFEIDAPAKFTGVYVRASGKDNKKTIQSRLLEHLTLDNLRPAPMEFRQKYESGVKMGSAFYTPIE
jgi:hypothetical protein